MQRGGHAPHGTDDCAQQYRLRHILGHVRPSFLQQLVPDQAQSLDALGELLEQLPVLRKARRPGKCRGGREWWARARGGVGSAALTLGLRRSMGADEMQKKTRSMACWRDDMPLSLLEAINT
eukprot:5268479-Prymnesium_polylepis.1